jgi:alpha-L-fucosidase
MMKITAIIIILFLKCASCLLAQQQWQLVHKELVVHNPPFKECHASTIVELSNGNMLVAWFGGAEEGAKDVCIWRAVNKKGAWSKPVVIATGIINDTLRYPCWNPVLFVAANKKLLLFYKVGPSPQEWWGMMKTSDDEGKTWSLPVRLPKGILGPIKNKPVLLEDGTMLAPSSEETQTKWSVHIERSADNGMTWQKIVIDTAGFDVIQPSILNYGQGRLQILCRSKQGTVVQSWSEDSGKTWTRLSKTALLNPNSGTDAVTLRNGEQLIVDNPEVPGKEWNNGRAKLRVAVSKDGISWTDVVTLENGTKEEFSYPAVIQSADLRVHITYTYDRKNIKYVVLQNKKAAIVK